MSVMGYQPSLWTRETGQAEALVSRGLMAEPQLDVTLCVRGGPWVKVDRLLYLKKPLLPSHVITLK